MANRMCEECQSYFSKDSDPEALQECENCGRTLCAPGTSTSPCLVIELRKKDVVLRGGKEQNYGYLCRACVQADFKGCTCCGGLYHCKEGGDVITKSGISYGFHCGTCRHANFKKSE